MFNAPAAELVRSNDLVKMRAELEDLRGASEKAKEDGTELVRLRLEVAELKMMVEKAKEEEAMTIPSGMPDVKQSPPDVRTVAFKPPQINTTAPALEQTRDDDFVLVNTDGEDVEYSPGGRPRAVMQTKMPVQPRPASPPVRTGLVQSQIPTHRHLQPGSPSDNAPMTLDDYVTDRVITYIINH